MTINNHLESEKIKFWKELDEVFSKLPQRIRPVLEVVERDVRIIEQNLEKRIYPKTYFDLSTDEYMSMWFEEMKKFNQKGKAGFN